MENPIKQNPYVIIKGYDGRNETKRQISKDAKDGIDTIIIGNLTDIVFARLSETCVDKDIRNYIGNINAHTKFNGLTYIPGEGDFQIYTELNEIIQGCKERKYLSNVTSMKYASDIMKIAEKIKDSRSDLMSVYKELASLALNDSNTFLYAIRSLMTLGNQPIYTVRKSDNGTYLLISHANPEGRIVSKEIALTLANKVVTIKELANRQTELDQSPAVGSRHNNLQTTINKALLSYVLDPNNPMRKKISESLSDPYGDER